MTSASVKDVGALMNFIGGRNFTKTGTANLSDSFGDVMSKTQSGSTDSQNKAVVKQESEKPKTADTLKSRKETVKTVKTADKAAKTEEVTDEQSKAVEEVCKEVAGRIAEELGITEEEVAEAMAELGLSVFSLLEPADLTQLVLAVSGEQDAMALLTNESLFTDLQNVIALAEDAKMGLMEELSLSPEQMQALLEEVQNGVKKQTEQVGEVNNADLMEQAAEEKQPQITVEVKAGDETVKLAADENGNVTGTLETVPAKTEDGALEKHENEHDGKKGEESRGQSESGLNTGHTLIDALTPNKAQEVGSFEQTTAFFSEQTQDIMNQIMDYMKIQLKPGMDQLQMQLHPENLGTVHIQLLNKGGEITAQFHVQNEAVKEVLESQITTLQENLKQQGVKVEAVQVTVESHGFESNLWQGQGREENASSRESRKSPRRVNLNALEGLPEEEVSEEDLLTARMMEVNGNTVDYTA